MPVHSDSVETQNAILNGWLGPNRAVGSPDSYEVELWQDDPRTVGAAQADWGGYAAVVWDSDDWGPAAGGETETTSLVSMGTPSSAGTDAARFWALRNVTSDVLAFSAPLEEPISVNGSATNPVRIRPTVKLAD